MCKYLRAWIIASVSADLSINITGSSCPVHCSWLSMVFLLGSATGQRIPMPLHRDDVQKCKLPRQKLII